MENVTDRTSNPFGMKPPCGRPDDGRHAAVHGYGDANADFHAIGDYAGVHGGAETGVPFTGSVAGRRLQAVFHAVGWAADAYSDEPRLSNLFTSYLYRCVPPAGRTPTPAAYENLERFFDAELRAINAHVLLPVGDRAMSYALREHTTKAGKLPHDAGRLHARQIRGRGFLVVPIREPADWDRSDRDRLVATLEAILASDYRQTKGVATVVG